MHTEASTSESAHPATGKLAAFGASILMVHLALEGSCDLDGGTIQEMAVAAGVMEQREVTKPCCKTCLCAESGNIPGLCFFTTSDISPFIRDKS